MYWETIWTPIVGAPIEPPELPVARAQLARSTGSEERWAAAPASLRDLVIDRGFGVTPASRPNGYLGDFYSSLRDEHVPWVVTLDALFFLTHLAIDRALADIDAYVIAPLASTMLHRLDVRLGVDGPLANADLGAAYVVARVLVGVALALAEPTYEAAPAIARLVAEEKARVVAHAGISTSPMLGAPIDYTAMSPVGMADRDGVRSGWFRAAAWLQGVPLTFEGAGERGHRARVDVAVARLQGRAAMILARLLDYSLDAEAATAWEGIERAGELVIGDAAGVTRRDLSAAAAQVGVDLRKGDWMANVVPVDRVRHAVARDRETAAFHLLASRAVPDGETLQSLTFPMVGARAAGSPAPSRTEPSWAERDGMRTLPTALDVAAWLGSGEARAALHDSGDDAYERYQETLDRLIHARPTDVSTASQDRHRTSYVSMIDAIETWLLPSRGDGVQPAASNKEWRKRKAEVAMSAWTELRHDATALTRIPLTQVRLAPRSPAGVTAPMFVEPHPEAIAKLAGLVRQTQRALVTEGLLRSGSSALAVLGEVDDLLWTALGAAVYETADEPLPAMLSANLAAFPARMRALDVALEGTGAAEVPLAVDVHVDVPSGRILEEATGRIEELWMVMREPGTHVLWLALGASIPHHELVQSASRRTSDSVWRARLQNEGDPAPEAMARAYVAGAEASTRQVSPNSWPR
jgi:hypothetical protein